MPTVALTMIVRDAAADLPACVASARGAVDEIVIADTGSRDATAAIARGLGARVIAVAWQDDFAAARNAALEAATADWVLSLDADERLDPAGEGETRRLTARRGADGYEVSIRNYYRTLAIHMYDQLAQPNDGRLAEARDFAGFTVHTNIRLFRRAPHIRFAGRVHENVARSIAAAGGRIGTSRLLVHHFGLADPAALVRKAAAYRALGRRKVGEMPEDAQAHLELAAEELEHFANPAEALGLCERACQLQPALGLAWYYRGLAASRLGRPQEAAAALERAEANGVSGSLLFEARGDAHYESRAFAAAARDYRRALKRQPEVAEVESKLGLVEARQGEVESGLARMRRAIRRAPGESALRDRLIAAAAALGQLEAAARAADDYLAAIAAPAERAYLRAASIHAERRDWRGAKAALRAGLARWPGSAALNAALREAEGAASAAPVPNFPALT